MARLVWLGGAFSVLAALLHVSMHLQFGTDPSIQGLSPDNKFVLYTLNACIAYVMVSFAYLSFFHWRELASARLGRALAVAMALFWFVRAAAVPVFAGVEPVFPVLAVFIYALPGLSYLVPLLLPQPGGAGQRRQDKGYSAASGAGDRPIVP